MFKKICLTILAALFLSTGIFFLIYRKTNAETDSNSTEAYSITRVWIDVPIQNLVISPVDQEVRIEGHASASSQPSKIKIIINDQDPIEVAEIQSTGALYHFEHFWTPNSAGKYTIKASAVLADGSESPEDSVKIEVVEEIELEPEEEGTEAEEETVEEGKASVRFRADSYTVNAGSCTTIRWETENAESVSLNGSSAADSGTQRTCVCAEEVHTLSVSNPDGSTTEKTLTIEVIGSCESDDETPAPDETPPPAPTIVDPKDGEVLDCTAFVTLDWSSVSDESGISGYTVQAQTRPNEEADWEDLSGSPWSGISDTELEISTDCAWYYRWRVKATDKAGNAGSYSGWEEFTVTLM